MVYVNYQVSGNITNKLKIYFEVVRGVQRTGISKTITK